jgi:hypothetical protein
MKYRINSSNCFDPSSAAGRGANHWFDAEARIGSIVVRVCPVP